VVDARLEPEVARDVAQDDRVVPRPHELADQWASGSPLGAQQVALEEPGQGLVRVEHVAVLVRAVQGAPAQSVQQAEALAGAEQAGRQDRDLTLEHHLEASDPGSPLAQVAAVVRVEQRVVATVDAATVRAFLDLAERYVDSG